MDNSRGYATVVLSRTPGWELEIDAPRQGCRKGPCASIPRTPAGVRILMGSLPGVGQKTALANPRLLSTHTLRGGKTIRTSNKGNSKPTLCLAISLWPSALSVSSVLFIFDKTR